MNPVDVFAAHRLTRLITEDQIPLGHLRERVLSRWPGSLIAEWMTCPWCAGLWVAVGVAAARRHGSRWWGPAARVLATSSITGLLSEWEQR